MKCRRCGSDNCIKYGTANDKQRYQCKECKRLVTDSPVPGKSRSMKAFAVLLHLEFGASFSAIAKYLQVSLVSVMRWARDRGKTLERPKVSGDCKIMLLDKMWHFICKRKVRFGSGRPMICYQKELSPGRLASVIIEL